MVEESGLQVLRAGSTAPVQGPAMHAQYPSEEAARALLLNISFSQGEFCSMLPSPERGLCLGLLEKVLKQCK